MQPYLFPYLPYFQLIHAVDSFVIFDTAQFIRRGWMNRNRINLHGSAHSYEDQDPALASNIASKSVRKSLSCSS